MVLIEKLCSALTPSQKTESPTPATSTSTLSPIKRAGLRSTYIKKMTELKQLHKSDLLTDSEYQEQRMEVFEVMSGLKK